MKKKITILITIITLLILISVTLIFSLFSRYTIKKSLEDTVLPFAIKNEKPIFKIDKITLFSGCNAKNKNATSSNFTIENLYQYTDIALFIIGISFNKLSWGL